VTAFLTDEVTRLLEARKELFDRTRGLDLSFAALEELVYLLYDGSFAECDEALRHIRAVKR
jgi:hypothetical protein